MTYTDLFFHYPKILANLLDILSLKMLLTANYSLEEANSQEYIEVNLQVGTTLVYALSEDDNILKYGA